MRNNTNTTTITNITVHTSTRRLKGQVDIGRLKTFMQVYGYNAKHLAFVLGTTPDSVSEKLDKQRPFSESELSAIESFFSLDNGELLIKP